MHGSLDPTAERALALNLDPEVYGTFAEIGAGQEVARWFFSVGGAAGTVAKTMSAYDMAFSDAIYGKAPRYVSRERVEEMLAHEFRLLRERLDAARGDKTRFFAFADTAAARSFSGSHDCHGWAGIRFQHACRAEPSDLVIHVRLLDATNPLQQEAMGRLGVNLTHAALTLWKNPAAMLAALLDEIGPSRIEIDWISARGPAFATSDDRVLALELVRRGYTPAVLFDTAGRPTLAAEAVRKTCVLVERGRFAPVTRLNLEMMERAAEAFAADGAGDVREIMEISMRNLRGDAQVADADYLTRIDLVAATGTHTLISAIGPFYDLAEYLAARHVSRTGLVLGVPLLRAIFDERHYSGLSGGILEAFGRLFTHAVRLYVHPTRDAIDGRMVTVENLRVSPHLAPLLEYLRANGLLQGLACDDSDLRTYSSDEVRDRICSGDPTWKDLVVPEVAALIEARGYFGGRCELPAG
jgi:hypothetical protein